jgi:hypothetical protein
MNPTQINATVYRIGVGDGVLDRLGRAVRRRHCHDQVQASPWDLSRAT